MLAGKKLIHCVLSLIIGVTSVAHADWKENAKAIDISGGENHTLVLTQNNTAWACGANGGFDYFGPYYGVLGTGSDDPYLTEQNLLRVHDGDMNNTSGCLEDITDIAAGWKHSLALDVNGLVWAWGNNYQGQLGDGTTRNRTTPVKVHGGEMGTLYLQNIIAISAGRSGEHSLAVDANNFVYGWGRNYEGQCGNGESGSSYGKLTPVKVLSGEQGLGTYLENIIAVSAGEQHSMALEKLDPCDPNCNGRVYTWGDNEYKFGEYGKLGIGDEQSSHIDTPVQVHSPNNVGVLENIVAISAGWDHCMALEKYDPADPNCKGRVYTWGRNTSLYPYHGGGQLGNGTTNYSSTPVVVLAGEQDPCDPNSYLENIISVSAGEAHSMALDVYGNVWTWGDNYFGQLGNGTNDPCSLTPVKVVGPDLNHNGVHEPNEGYLENIVTISAGFWHCLAIDAYGTIWTYGKGDLGRLGKANNTDDCGIPHPIAVVYNITQEDFRFSIQDAIDDAVNGDIIQAMPGSFYENIDFGNKTLTLRSTDPNNFGVVANTIIDGYRSGSGNVITFGSGQNSVLAGFTITNAVGSGIYCDSSSPQITNCIIEDNGDNGIYNQNSSSAIVANNIIRNNGGYGIHYYWIWPDMTSEIKNNWIHSNGSGIYIKEVDEPVTIQNNTIVDNTTYGIILYSNSATPSVSNCIIWGNKVDNLYAVLDPFGDVTYSCIQNWTGEGLGNINADPCFVGADANNYHLGPNSPCIDKGNTNLITDPNETDIDGEPRILNGDANYTKVVDMGADEFFWSPADFDRNGIVNFLDYAVLATAWLTESGDGNYNEDCDLEDNNTIDYNDLALFCKDWLWQEGGETSMSSGFSEALYTAAPPQQPQIELQPEPEPQLQVQFEPELLQPEPQPQLTGEDIQELVDWLEELWLTDEEVRSAITEADWLEFIETLRQTPIE